MVVLPVGNTDIAKHAGDILHIGRLPHHQCIYVWQAGVIQIAIPRQVRCQAHQLIRTHAVVGCGTVAVLYPGPVALGDTALNLNHPACGLFSRFALHQSGQCKHLADVRLILRQHFFVAFTIIQIVVTIRQPQTRLTQRGDVLV